MSVMNKLLGGMRLNEDPDEDEFYDEDDYYDDDPEPTPSRPQEESGVKRPRVVTPLRGVSKKNSGSGMEVKVVKPTQVSESRDITDILLDNRTVVLNLENLDISIAQRIIDFVYGSAYAMHGNMQKISNCIFIITPPSVDVSGDFYELFAGGDGANGADFL